MFAPQPTSPPLHAAFRREIAEHRLNRFLHVHLTLCAVVGLLPLFTPDAAARSAPAWVLQAVLYCLSLSSLLLGLSAAHGDADEFPVLFTQPVGRGAWLAGKARGARGAARAGVAAAGRAGGAHQRPDAVARRSSAAAAAGVCLVAGAARARGRLLGPRSRARPAGRARRLVRAAVRHGPRAARALRSARGCRQHADAWVLPLMLNPLSALRVTMLFTLEQTAPASIGAGPARRVVARPRRPLARGCSPRGRRRRSGSASPAPAAGSTSSAVRLVVLGAGDCPRAACVDRTNSMRLRDSTRPSDSHFASVRLTV